MMAAHQARRHDRGAGRGRIGAALALLSATALTLAGCGGTDFGPAPETLGEAEYALYFSAQGSEIDGRSTSGRMALVDGDGTVSVLPTRGMDVGQPVWTEDALFFSDLTSDYRLDDTALTTIESPKADYQYGMHATSPSTAVGIYNLGFTDEGGYTSQVVTTTGGTSTLTEVEGGYYITANCEGTIYGVGAATGPYSVTGDPDTEPVMLNQLTGIADGAERNVGLSTQARDNAQFTQAPCLDGSLLYISDAIGGGLDAPVKPVLSRWDVVTGEYSDVVLTAEGIDEPLLRSDGIDGPQVTAESVRDGQLQWFGVNGSVMSTDLETGRTARLFETEGAPGEDVLSQAVFQGDEVIVLLDSDGSSPYQLIRYDRDHGTELSCTVLDAPAADIADGLHLRGFAVRPHT